MPKARTEVGTSEHNECFQTEEQAAIFEPHSQQKKLFDESDTSTCYNLTSNHIIITSRLYYPPNFWRITDPFESLRFRRHEDAPQLRKAHQITQITGVQPGTSSRIQAPQVPKKDVTSQSETAESWVGCHLQGKESL